MESISKTYGVEGMHCAGCVASVEKVLLDIEGVHSAFVNLNLENVKLENGIVEYWKMESWKMESWKWNGGILEMEKLEIVLGFPVVQFPLEPATRTGGPACRQGMSESQFNLQG